MDWRHHLAGRPVHSGDFLQLQTPLGWMDVRYEMNNFERREAVLYFRDGGWRLDPHGMVLRWPPKED